MGPADREIVAAPCRDPAGPCDDEPRPTGCARVSVARSDRSSIECMRRPPALFHVKQSRHANVVSGNVPCLAPSPAAATRPLDGITPPTGQLSRSSSPVRTRRILRTVQTAARTSPTPPARPHHQEHDGLGQSTPGQSRAGSIDHRPAARDHPPAAPLSVKPHRSVRRRTTAVLPTGTLGRALCGADASPGRPRETVRGCVARPLELPSSTWSHRRPSNAIPRNVAAMQSRYLRASAWSAEGSRRRAPGALDRTAAGMPPVPAGCPAHDAAVKQNSPRIALRYADLSPTRGGRG